jgi:hypothetical protein
MERKLQVSSGLVLAGLVIEAVSLRWQHPTAFLLFMLAGGAAIAAGMLLFLIAIVSTAREKEEKNDA